MFPAPDHLTLADEQRRRSAQGERQAQLLAALGLTGPLGGRRRPQWLGHHAGHTEARPTPVAGRCVRRPQVAAATVVDGPCCCAA